MGPEEPTFRVTDKLAHPEPGYVRLSPVNMVVFVAINFYLVTMNFSRLFLSQSGMGDLRVCEYRPGDIPVIHLLFEREEGVLSGNEGLILCHVAEPVWANYITAGIDVRGCSPKGGIGPDPLQGIFDPGLFKIKSFDIRLSSDGHEESPCMDLLCLVFIVLQDKSNLTLFHTDFLRLTSGQEFHPVLCQFLG